MSDLDGHEVREETGSKAFAAGCSIRAPAASIRSIICMASPNGSRRGCCDLPEARRCGFGARTAASIVETPGGAVRARQAIIATNGYSDLTDATRHCSAP